MTNTGDFRRYSYQSDVSYVVQNFSAVRQQATAPAQPKPRERFTVHENTQVKTNAQLKAEQHKSSRQMAQVFAIAVMCLLIVGVVVGSFAIKNDLTKQLATKQKQISNAQSECISLESQLDALVSMSMIEKYAVEELGMTKVRANQVIYMDVEQYRADRQAELAQQNSNIIDSNK